MRFRHALTSTLAVLTLALVGTGTHHSGCSPIGTLGGNNSRAPYNVKLGRQCARFYSHGVFIGEQCHRIQ